MDEKWRVSRVELLEGGLLYGFVLYDQKGRPSVSFGYADRAKAKLRRNHVALITIRAPQNLLAFGLAEVLSKLCGKLIDPYRAGP